MAQALNKTQLNYTVERLTAAKQRKLEAFAKQFDHINGVCGSSADVKPNPHGPDDAAKELAISNGTAKLCCSLDSYRYVRDAFNYPTSPAARAWDAETAAQVAKFDDFAKQLDAEVQTLLDKLHLSGAEDALAMIVTFTA